MQVSKAPIGDDGTQHWVALQVPNDFLLDLTHTLLQQLPSVRHVWPSDMQGPALAARHPTTMRAAVSIGTKNDTRRVRDRFMTPPVPGGLPERRCGTGCSAEGPSSDLLNMSLAERQSGNCLSRLPARGASGTTGHGHVATQLAI